MNEQLERVFAEVAKHPTPIQSLWYALCSKTRCTHCRLKFPQGIVHKYPGQVIPIDAFVWFTSSYLAHMQTTHGLSPETINSFLADLSTGVGK